MDIQEFVRESLCQIVEGVNAARNQHESIAVGGGVATDAKLPPNVMLMGPGDLPVYLVEFDLAVTTTGKTEASGKAGIAIVQVFNAGGEKSSTNETISATRIKFSGLSGIDEQRFMDGLFIAISGHRPVTTQRHVTLLRNQIGGEVTPNNGAAENRSGRLRAVTARASSSGAPSDSGRLFCVPPLGTRRASPQPPSAVSELESLEPVMHFIGTS